VNPEYEGVIEQKEMIPMINNKMTEWQSMISKITTKIYTSIFAVQQAEQDMADDVPIHGYNPRRRLTKQKALVLMIQIRKATGVQEYKQYITIHPMPHDHVMLIQMNNGQGLKIYGENGNDAVLKEFRQLQDRELLMPVKRENMSHD